MHRDIEQLTSLPEYHSLVRTRDKIIWPLLIATVAAYMVFILAIAFTPSLLGRPVVSGGVVSVGILLGLALIFFNFVITLLYVRLANRDIEPLIAQMHKAAGESK